MNLLFYNFAFPKKIEHMREKSSNEHKKKRRSAFFFTTSLVSVSLLYQSLIQSAASY